MFYRLKRLRNKLTLRIHAEYCYVRSTDQVATVVLPEGLQITLTNEDTINQLKEIWDVNLDEMKQRLQQGSFCLISLMNGAPAGYHWIQTAGKHLFQPAGKYINVKPGEWWIYHVRVSDVFKGLGIAPAVYADILSKARTEGASKVWIYTAKSNHANQRALQKLGFTHQSTYYSLKVGSSYYPLFSIQHS